MRFQGKDQAAAYRLHGPERRDFLEKFWTCAVCGSCAGVDVHEMTPGKNRMRAFGVRAAWLPACAVCNCDRLTDKTEWPLARQLALKILVDPAYFNLTEIRRILAPDGTPIDKLPIVVTGAEILEQVVLLLIERKAA